ncbi:MAG: hypothetical protein AVO39_06000 [delta proteobacterium MLS_D]|jgi:hypothetical protein|nr:MAG: hypothetical protein AVO39_06000 [delta proteobacterium MLS_D]
MDDSSQQLVVFDYSGTLCLDAVAFSRPGRIEQELASSGLADLGVRDASFFWNNIIASTWRAGFTTPIGYKAILERRLVELFGCDGDSSLLEKIRMAASRFSSRYFAEFRIDDRWRFLLERVWNNRACSVVVATDHYAEATDAIINSFAAMNIEARPLLDTHDERCFLVANSADLGCMKVDRAFWRMTADRVPGLTGTSLVVVDDFGYNESAVDYGAYEQTSELMRDTVAALEDVFGPGARIVPFLIGGADRQHMPPDRAIQNLPEALVKKAEQEILRDTRGVTR